MRDTNGHFEAFFGREDAPLREIASSEKTTSQSERCDVTHDFTTARTKRSPRHIRSDSS